MSDSRSRSVLLVDDDPGDQRLIANAFARIGSAAEIEVASTADEAIEALQQASLPVLGIVDLRLAGHSGLVVIEWARADERARFVPFVVLSGSADRGDVRAAYDAGANAYLVKPHTSDEIDELAQRIDAFWLGACALADDPR